MSAWHSPGSIYNVSHREANKVLNVEVQAQEKVDGSFFAFGLFPSGRIVDGEWVDEGGLELKVRSKGAVMVPDAPQKMFQSAVDTVKSIKHLLKPGWQYRGEVLAKPKHNALAYDRVPTGNIILFDICTDEETYADYDTLTTEAGILGLEVVPQLYVGCVDGAEQLRTWLDTTSVLGGQKIEGVVLKPLVPLYGLDKKLLMVKFVSEAFKEVHRKSWGESNPTNKDIITLIANAYSSPARYQKALIHLKEEGKIAGELKDIGLLIKEIGPDIRKECEEEIKDALFRHAWPHIQRMVVRGVPNWYKELLLTESFEQETEVSKID